MITQEYVQPPVTVVLSPHSAHTPITRSMMNMQEALITTDRVQLGNFYSLSTDSGDGFVLAKCKNFKNSMFDVLLLERIDEDRQVIIR